MTTKRLKCVEFWDECMGSIGYQIEDYLEDYGLDRIDIVNLKYAVLYDAEAEIARSYCLLLCEIEEPEIGILDEPMNELEQQLHEQYGEYFDEKQ